MDRRKGTEGKGKREKYRKKGEMDRDRMKRVRETEEEGKLERDGFRNRGKRTYNGDSRDADG